MAKSPHPGFRMPRPVNITARSSTITNSFVNSIIPVRVPTREQISRALKVLNIDENDVCCAYCGDPSSEWDHLRPIVANKRPTGFISEIANLVPACGKCNQSKSGAQWKDWMLGTAPQSPATRKIPDLVQRVERLKEFEMAFPVTRIDFESVVPSELWQQHWRNLDRIHQLMRDCQQIAQKVRDESLKAVMVD